MSFQEGRLINHYLIKQINVEWGCPFAELWDQSDEHPLPLQGCIDSHHLNKSRGLIHILVILLCIQGV